jgi:ubiquinone/menaquinone biosynthesis C-methylase UbiE
MASASSSAGYLQGICDAEHERLIRQAKRLAPVTERFLREAGIGAGQRVLDVGAGVGDVTILLSHPVGPAGDVVAIERDARSIDRAKAWVIEAGLRNVTFTHTDIAQFSTDTLFDALVGRYILQFLPDPVGTLRSLSNRVRPGGVVAFQEGSWAPFVLLSRALTSLVRRCVLDS